MLHIKKVMEYAEFPEEARNSVLEITPKVANDSRACELMKKLVNKQFSDLTAEIMEPNKAIADELGIHEYQYFMSFFLTATELMLEKYHERNIDEEIFWFAMIDFRCKLMECWENYGIWGTSATAWHAAFFTLNRFALGRFQYDYSTFANTRYTKNGITIKKGDPCLRFHIPSSGPLTRELRHDSYRRAYEFNKERYGGIVPITCASWLLYPKHVEFLSPTSNLIDFIHDFDYVTCNGESTEFANKWRVFTHAYDDKPASELPEKTSMQRSYKKRLMEGGLVGGGYGVLFHDEKGIIR